MKTKEQWIKEYNEQRDLPRHKRTLIHSDGSYVEAIQRDALQWHPIATAPRGRFVLVGGPSGYMGTPMRVEVCRQSDSGCWRNHANDMFVDGGASPTHWMELPTGGLK